MMERKTVCETSDTNPRWWPEKISLHSVTMKILNAVSEICWTLFILPHSRGLKGCYLQPAVYDGVLPSWYANEQGIPEWLCPKCMSSRNPLHRYMCYSWCRQGSWMLWYNPLLPGTGKAQQPSTNNNINIFSLCTFTVWTDSLPSQKLP